MEVEMGTDPNPNPNPNPNTSPSAADDAATASGEAKACADCHTTKTPLWRGGPEGPKVCFFHPPPSVIAHFLPVGRPAGR